MIKSSYPHNMEENHFVFMRIVDDFDQPGKFRLIERIIFY